MSDESPITTIAELLAESQLEHLQPVVGTSSLASLDSVLNEGGRVKLLAHLQRLGVTKLPERQKCANSLSKAQRVGRLKPSTDEHDRPPQPAPVETPKSAAVDISDNTPSLPSLPPPPPRDPKQPLRVLCLHSFRANAAILEQQMNLTGQATFFDGLAEFTYLDAPYTCNAEDEAKQYDVMKKFFPTSRYGAYREWFNATDVAKGGTGPDYVTYARYEDAIRAVEDALATASPPFDGLMGFSQGGSLAMWIATLQARGRLSSKVPTLRFLYVQSARLPRDHSCKGLFETSLSMPAMVTYAEDDADVKAHETRALMAKLDPAPLTVKRTAGGHGVMPMRMVSADDQARIKEFLHARR